MDEGARRRLSLPTPMSLLAVLAVFWAVVHALHHVYARRQATKSILPSLTAARRRRLDVTLKHAYLHVETTQFNDAHDRLSLRFAKGTHTLWRRAVYAFYDVGSVAGVLGMLAAIYLLCSTAFWLATSLLAAPTTPAADSLRKRALDVQDSGVQAATSTDAPVQILIPGVTLPLSHLPLLLAALFISQVIHEAGHAVAAALEQVPLLNVGASLLVLLPSAHVALPSGSLAALAPRARLRVIAAGAWHNLVLWLALAAAARAGLASLCWSVAGYRDVGALGQVVTAVEEGSPVQAALPVGALVTRIDDVPAGGAETLRLEGGKRLGWCMDSAWFLSLPDGCCRTDESSVDSACFTAGAVEQCAPILEVLRPDVEVVKRCAAPADCAEGNACISLRDDQRVMRVEYIPPGHSERRVTIWSGPREEFFEDVDTSAYMPRLALLPLWLPGVVGTLTSYISTLTLSLYLFNLLPLPYLDGAQFMDALAELAAHTSPARSHHDAELGEGAGPTRRHWRWYARAKQGVQLALSLVLVICVLLGLWRARE